VSRYTYELYIAHVSPLVEHSLFEHTHTVLTVNQILYIAILRHSCACKQPANQISDTTLAPLFLVSLLERGERGAVANHYNYYTMYVFYEYQWAGWLPLSTSNNV
jgi:hypothetical protein